MYKYKVLAKSCSPSPVLLLSCSLTGKIRQKFMRAYKPLDKYVFVPTLACTTCMWDKGHEEVVRAKLIEKKQIGRYGLVWRQIKAKIVRAKIHVSV